MEKELSGYQLVVAPMLYLYRANIAEKMKKFVELGSTLVGTYWSGIVNDTDLCYLGGMPGGGMARYSACAARKSTLCTTDSITL